MRIPPRAAGIPSSRQKDRMHMASGIAEWTELCAGRPRRRRLPRPVSLSTARTFLTGKNFVTNPRLK